MIIIIFSSIANVNAVQKILLLSYGPVLFITDLIVFLLILQNVIFFAVHRRFDNSILKRVKGIKNAFFIMADYHCCCFLDYSLIG